MIRGYFKDMCENEIIYVVEHMLTTLFLEILGKIAF